MAIDKQFELKCNKSSRRRSNQYYLNEHRLINLVSKLKSVTSVSGDTVYCETTSTFDEHKESLAEWNEACPEIDSYDIFCRNEIRLTFITKLGFKIIMFCKEIEKTLTYYSNGDCVVEITEPTPQPYKTIKCLRG